MAHDKLTMLKVVEIRTDLGTQTRCSIDEATVAEYADAVKAGANLPPVEVFHDGNDYILADGFHRVMAYQRIARETISAKVFKGTAKDALIHSLGSNKGHGLKRTNEDKRRAALWTIRECPDWSDRKIAEHTGLSNTFISNVRSESSRQVSTVDTSTKPQLSTVDSCVKRTGKDGKSRKLPAKPKKPAKPDQPQVSSASASIGTDPTGEPSVSRAKNSGDGYSNGGSKLRTNEDQVLYLIDCLAKQMNEVRAFVTPEGVAMLAREMLECGGAFESLAKKLKKETRQ